MNKSDTSVHMHCLGSRTWTQVTPYNLSNDVMIKAPPALKALFRSIPHHTQASYQSSACRWVLISSYGETRKRLILDSAPKVGTISTGSETHCAEDATIASWASQTWSSLRATVRVGRAGPLRAQRQNGVHIWKMLEIKWQTWSLFQDCCLLAFIFLRQIVFQGRQVGPRHLKPTASRHKICFLFMASH